MMESDRESVLGYGVDTRGIGGCVASICAAMWSDNNFRWMACLNPHSCAVARRDPQFSQALHDADWVVPDGSGIVLASRMLGGRIRERVTGSDIFRAVMQELERTGGSVFFLGSTEETLAAIRQRVAAEYPHVRLAGTYSPPFKPEFSPEENEAMLTAINASKTDVLWVGMTAPKQEKWIHANRDRLQVRFAGAIGAVFDFYTGRVKRSHPFFQRLGLEWLPRLLRQPGRLWRRTVIGAPVFLFLVLRQRLTGKT